MGRALCIVQVRVCVRCVCPHSSLTSGVRVWRSAPEEAYDETNELFVITEEADNGEYEMDHIHAAAETEVPRKRMTETEVLSLIEVGYESNAVRLVGAPGWHPREALSVSPRSRRRSRLGRATLLTTATTT